jgi:hypothetical protein
MPLGMIFDHPGVCFSPKGENKFKHFGRNYPLDGMYMSDLMIKLSGRSRGRTARGKKRNIVGACYT